MYSYRPSTQTAARPKPIRLVEVASPASQKGLIFRLGLYVLAGVVGALLVVPAVNKLTAGKVDAAPSVESAILPNYTKKIEQESDLAKLVKKGTNLLNKNMALFAVTNLKRASDLDPNFRDAAYGWAYALLQAKGNNLSQQDFDALHTAIARAEKVDPTYIPLLKLKLVVAGLEKKPEIAQAAQARIDLLNKK